jgi:rhodanese-related sulfurtransferase
MTIKSINAQELKTKMDKKESLILVDCRELNEWQLGKIPSAIFIPLSDFPEQSEKNLKNKSAQIILQCRSGARSMKAAYFLEEQGFTDLTNLEGGILGWNDEGFDTELGE